jgi:UDP-N-acetylmuramoyl-L-alanyl-D-glutamate--2,6-diaminopimelate ligase
MNPLIAERSSKAFDCHQLGKLGVSIERLVTDSREVLPGDTFLAISGARTDARKLIPQAILAGANAVIWESNNFSWNPSWQVPSLGISGLREKAGYIADCVYGHPSERLCVAGFTGTNGKTSCSHWFSQAMNVLHKKTAVMGTLGSGFANELKASTNTTPDPVMLQKNLALFLQHGATHVAMEVSSHGIEQGRLNGTTISVAILTNLSRDHLDYHKSMDAYAESKARLFFWPGLKCAVLNLDDVLGVELFQQLAPKSVQIIGYSFRKDAVKGCSGRCSIVYGCNTRVDLHGMSLEIEYQGERLALSVDLVGKFNAVNLLAVTAALLACGIPFADAVNALRFVKSIPGRMEKFGGGEYPTAIVDYAHTPDALEKVLSTLLDMLHMQTTAEQDHVRKAGRLLCVIGCGGERDRGKRQLIGEVAMRFADEVIFTSDNPRSEDPREIIQDMIGTLDNKNLQIEINRELAIYQAISSASAGDIVLIAGKGHETYQEINGQKIPFSDAQTVQQVLSDLSDKRGGRQT